MTKLELLIKKLCPDGVEYKELHEIFNTRNGYTPSKSNSEFWTNCCIPWFRMEDIRENGNILSDSIQKVSKKAVKGKLFPANSIIVATSATIGEHALITVESLANQRFTYLMLKERYIEQFNIKFLYYYCYKLDQWCLSHLNQGSFPSVDMSKFPHFKIPLPPLEIQEEIVRILDNFTELTAELMAELTARKKQYEYYRDLLLDFGSECEWRTLESFVDVRDGTHDSPKPSEYGFPLITSKNISGRNLDLKNCYLIAEKDYDSINVRSKVDITDVLVSMIGTIGETIIVTDEPNYAIKNIGLIKTGSLLTSKFIRYYISSGFGQRYIQENIKGTAPRYLSLTALRKFKIPVPSLFEQTRIVNILDRFDKLCNDISEGLPAEIEARRKQYEYYRDKLLSFEEVRM